MEQVVFVVSDDPSVRQSIAGRVRRDADAHVLPMRGGEPVLAWARALRPWAIVLDLGVDADEACALADRLTGGPEAPGAAVLAIGADCAAARRRAEAAGCTTVLTGPTDPARLADALAACQPDRRTIPLLARA
jgi:CheY-like chemotaxis protein